MSVATHPVKQVDSALTREGLNNLIETFSPEHLDQLYRDNFPFYKTTFWYPREEQAENAFESIIDELALHVKPDDSIIGVEWWFSVMHINKTPQWLLPCHFDRADISERDPAKILHPAISSVLFLNSVPYGELVVTDQPMRDPKTGKDRQPQNMHFVLPDVNRYVMFPGDLYHGVIGRMWRDELPDSLRVSMAVNWWTEKPSAEYLRPSRECLTAFNLS